MLEHNTVISNASKEVTDKLTQIAFEAKKYWNYPEEYFINWEKELTITKEYINSNIVRCIEYNNEIIGFYSMCFVENTMKIGNIDIEHGFWLDHMFIKPKYHKKGLGRKSFEDIRHLYNNKLIENTFRIFVDPNAIGFYEKMGAKFIRMSDSSIKDRRIPVYEYSIE